MRKRSLIPSPYRCLTGLRVSGASLVVMLSLLVLERAACAWFGDASPACNALQVPYEWWLVGAVIAGIAHTLYAAYVDFFRGRYYRELARLQQH